MPTLPIPFSGSNKNTDSKFLNGINYTCKNGVVDELGNLTRRPGQSLFVDLGTAAAVVGEFYSPKHNITISVSGQKIFTVDKTGTKTDITGDGIPELGSLVTFGDFGDFVMAANGGRIIRIPLDLTAVITLSNGSSDLWTGFDVELSDGATDLWTDSPTTAGEYYYTGTDAPRTPDSITAGGVTLTLGTLGSLVDGEYAWGDQDTLGANTLYVKVATGDPDGQASGYIKAVFGEYYYTGSALVSKPNIVKVNSVSLTEGTVGSLVDGEYGWGDQNSLGSNTLYIKTTNSDPDAEASGFVTGVINKTDYLQNSSWPTQVTHVAVINRRLVCNDLAFDARFHYSEAGDGTVYSGFATAEAQNDKLLGLYVENDRLMLFGANTLESWRDNGSTPFVPESQEYTQRGVISKHATAYCRDRWIWLDEYKQLVMLNGNQAVALPQQNARGLTKFLQELDLTDARGRYVVSAGRFYYMCLLPKAEKSFLYDIDKDEWYEISYWDELNAEDELYRAFSSTYASGEGWGQMLIGDSKSGKIYSFDTNTYTDNAETIRTVLTTGYIDRGTSENRKKTSRISGRIEIDNVTVADPSLIMSFKWRNENTNTWSYRPIKLYKLSNNQFRYSTTGLGQYYMRQYELEITSDAPFTMSPMMETFEVVR